MKLVIMMLIDIGRDGVVSGQVLTAWSGVSGNWLDMPTAQPVKEMLGWEIMVTAWWGSWLRRSNGETTGLWAAAKSWGGVDGEGGEGGEEEEKVEKEEEWADRKRRRRRRAWKREWGGKVWGVAGGEGIYADPICLRGNWKILRKWVKL